MSGGYARIILAQLALREVCNRCEGLLNNDAKWILGYWKSFASIPGFNYRRYMTGTMYLKFQVQSL